jgi:2-C-methyl-D-erythritol 4-phosphate cytidylyltransferase
VSATANGNGPVVGLVPAAGRGVRLGETRPKAFVPVGEAPMLRLAVDGLLRSQVVDHVVVMVPDELIEEAVRLCDGAAVTVVAGGAERLDSVRAGLAAAPDAEYFLVHDAARALTPPSLVRRVVAELRAGRGAVVPALDVTDTIKIVDLLGYVVETPDRAQLRAVQTPQGFEAALLRRAYAADHELSVTDDAGLVEALGEPVRTIPGDPLAFKITTALDLALARNLVQEAR